MSSGVEPRHTAAKHSGAVCAAIATWGALVVLGLWTWIHWYDRFDWRFSILAHVSAFIWWLLLLWLIYYLVFQIGGLFASSPEYDTAAATPSLAIVYTTCDDFDEGSCLSCVEEAARHPGVRVLVCDDSRQPAYQRRVREFCNEHAGGCTLVRRPDHSGHKAGNLNHAISAHVTEPLFLLADADQFLPSGYIATLTAALPRDTSHVAFVQGAHRGRLGADANPFELAMAAEVLLIYACDLPLKGRFGFQPMLGHGALIRRETWAQMGGFPEVVSEDIAFAMRAAAVRQLGVFAPAAISEEGVPFDFGAFVIRLRKFAAGAAEIARQELPAFVSGATGFTQAWDSVAWLFRYVSMPLATINGFVSAYVCHVLWNDGTPYLHPVLPYFYTWAFAAGLAVRLVATGNWSENLRFYFWSTAVYSAAAPIAGWSFLTHLVTNPTFVRTPKDRSRTALGVGASIGTATLGLAALTCSVLWRSPFSPFLAAQGASYLSFPLFGQLALNTWGGKFARVAILAPGVLMGWAIWAMWQWAHV